MGYSHFPKKSCEASLFLVISGKIFYLFFEKNIIIFTHNTDNQYSKIRKLSKYLLLCFQKVKAIQYIKVMVLKRILFSAIFLSIFTLTFLYLSDIFYSRTLISLFIIVYLGIYLYLWWFNKRKEMYISLIGIFYLSWLATR